MHNMKFHSVHPFTRTWKATHSDRKHSEQCIADSISFPCHLPKPPTIRPLLHPSAQRHSPRDQKLNLNKHMYAMRSKCILNRMKPTCRALQNHCSQISQGVIYIRGRRHDQVQGQQPHYQGCRLRSTMYIPKPVIAWDGQSTRRTFCS